MNAHVIGIYRHRFAESMSRILRDQLEPGWTAALWALDEAHESLAWATIGTGPGGKFDLLNAILRERPLSTGQVLVVTDDDIIVRPNGIGRMIDTMEAGGLDIAQPAHSRGSHSSHAINRRQPLSRARLTTFVEIGPVFAVRPPWTARVVPFPADAGMGWGLELEWSAMSQDGCRLGVVDEVSVLHPEAPNVTYRDGLDDEFRRLNERLVRAGYGSIRDAQKVVATWRPWQRRPPWLR